MRMPSRIYLSVMPFDTIVFDLDGTLVDSAPDLAEALNRVLDENGLPTVAPDAVRHMVGEGAARMIARGFAAAGRAVGDEPPDRLRQRFLAHYADCLADSTRPFPGAVAALETLAAAGRRLAVCTNKSEATSRALLDRLDLSRFFSAVVGGDSLAAHKPDPRHLVAAILRAGGAPERAVMVGDSIVDVEAARAAAVPVVAVSFGYTRIPPDQLGADALIENFDELLPALERLARGRSPQAASPRRG